MFACDKDPGFTLWLFQFYEGMLISVATKPAAATAVIPLLEDDTQVEKMDARQMPAPLNGSKEKLSSQDSRSALE